MWILSCDGDAFAGKRRWLRPGSTHLIGRTSAKVPDRHVCYINSTSVSRKHLVINVAPVQTGDSGRVYTRSVLTATDSSSKGTLVDGRKYHGETIHLDGDKKEYFIRLGQYSGIFKLEWKPVVLTKAAKKEGTALASEREKLEHADIKVVSEYLTNQTTHVIAKKRNTVEGLQALVQARWLVGDSFVNALAEVCKAHSGEEVASPLEDDFDTFWPNETGFITPTSSEPVNRPSAYLNPDPLRAEVFQDYSFIFLSPVQHDKLLPVIAGGGGKALLSEFRKGTSSTVDVVDYAKQVAGKKDARSFLLSQEPGPGGIVLVRPNDRDEGRIEEVMNGIEKSLNQRMIEQSELLDAILTKNASPLRRPLHTVTKALVDQEMQDAPTASSSIPRPPPMASDSIPPTSSVRRSAGPPQHHSATSQPPSRSSQEPLRMQEPPEDLSAEQPSTRRRRRIITTQTRAKFGDDYDPTQIIRATSDSPEPSQVQPNREQSARNTDLDEETSVDPGAHNAKKRPAPDDAEDHELAETDEQRYDRLYPGQAALKRQRTEDLKKAMKQVGKPTAEPANATTSPKEEANSKKGKRKALEPEPEIKEKLKARVKFEEERRLEEEGKDDMSAFTQDQIKEMANDFPASMFVQFDVLTLSQSHQDLVASHEDHPEWRGRQNFKRFRSNKVRNRDPNNPRERTQRHGESNQLFVTLEEVPGKGHGLGDEYWLETGHDYRKRNKDRSQKSHSQGHHQSSTSQSQTPSAVAPRQAAPAVGEQNVEEDEDDTHAFRRRLQRSREDDQEAEEGHNALDAPVRGAGPYQIPKGTARSTQTLRGDATQHSQRNASGKRPADMLGETSKASPAKKARQTLPPSSAAGKRATSTRMAMQTFAIPDDDKDDPTAFRRKRR